MRRGDSRRRVLRAAGRLFSRQGFAATSIGEIASKAQASPSSIYWHFRGGKDAILLEVLREAAVSFIERIVGTVRQAETPEQKADALLCEVQQQLERSPDTIRLIMQMALERAGHDASVRRCIQDVFRNYRAAIAAELRTTRPDRDPESLDRVAAIILATLQGLFLQWQLDPDAVDLDAIFGQLRDDVRLQLAARQALADG